MTDGSGGPRQGASGEGARGATVEDVVLNANTAFYNAFEAGDLDLMAAVWLSTMPPRYCRLGVDRRRRRERAERAHNRAQCTAS